MENAAKALGIAGGVLIAIVILASLIYTFKRVSMIPEQQEYKKEVEEVLKFNEQFQVYNKKLMYGVDVVSCLNKVIDNNKKSEDYADGAYNIDIEIEITSAVYDRFEIYYLDTTSKLKKETQMTSSTDLSDYGLDKNVGSIFKNENYDGKISKVKSNTKFSDIKTGNNGESWVFKSNLSNKNYTSRNEEDNKLLLDLSKDTTNMERVEINTDKTSEKRWTKIIWKTAAYDFKSKRFKCSKVEYSSEGRVNKICFVEC